MRSAQRLAELIESVIGPDPGLPEAAGWLRVMFEIMAQAELQFQDVQMIAALASPLHVIDDHRLDPLFPGGRLHQIVPKLDGDHLRHVLMLRDGANLFLGKSG